MSSSFYSSTGSDSAVYQSAQDSADQAQHSATEAAASLAEFKNLYMGSFQTAPTALQDGSLYYNENTNLLYYWNGTAWTATNTSVATTDDLVEGTTNLFLTDERIDDRVDSLLTAGSNITLTYDDVANTLTIASTGGGGSTLTDTDDLTEGTTNLYYTDARADARIAAAGHISDITGESLYDLSNVNTNASPADGQVLAWDNTNSYWTPVAASSGGGGISLTDISVTQNTAGTAALSYNSTTGVFSYTPPDLSSYLTNITGQSLYSLSNVNTSASPTDGQVLAWDNANSYWTPVAASSGGGGTGDTTHIRYSSSSGQQAPFNISTYHTAGTQQNAYTGQAATKDGNSGQGITVAYTGIGAETRGTGLTYDPTYKVELTNNTGSNISLSKTGTTSSLEVKFTSSSVSVTTSNTYVSVYLEPPTNTSNPPQSALQLFHQTTPISSTNSGIQHTLSDTAPTNNWTWADGESLVFYIALSTNSGTVSAADITLDELTFMYAGAASTYNSSTTTTQGIRLNFAYTRSYSTLNTTPAATDSLIGFYDGATASTDGNDYDWTVFVEEPNSALAADDMLIYSTSNGWTYGKPSLYALSNVNTSSAPTNGQVLAWDSANSYWTPTTSSGSGATTLSGLNDVNNATPTDGQVLTWDNANSYWKPATVSSSGGSSQSPNIVTGTFTTTSTSYVDAGEIVDTDDGFTGMFEVIVSAQIGTGSSASAWYGKLQVAYNKEAPGQTNWMTQPWFGNGSNSGSSGHNVSAIRIQPRWDTSTNKIYLQVKNGSSTSTVYKWTATLI